MGVSPITDCNARRQPVVTEMRLSSCLRMSRCVSPEGQGHTGSLSSPPDSRRGTIAMSGSESSPSVSRKSISLPSSTEVTVRITSLSATFTTNGSILPFHVPRPGLYVRTGRSRSST